MLLQPVITACTKVEDEEDQRKKNEKNVNIDIKQVFW
jgi:hypothetical protein